MAKLSWTPIFTRSMTRSLATLQRAALPATRRALNAVTPTVARVKPVARGRTAVKAPGRGATSAGQWLPGVAIGPVGARRYRLNRPAGIRAGERVPLLVMLHGCGQGAKGFAASTRVSRIAALWCCIRNSNGWPMRRAAETGSTPTPAAPGAKWR